MSAGARRAFILIFLILIVICVAIAVAQWRAYQNVGACRAHLPACPYAKRT